MRRLSFLLPHFLRVCWVSDDARATWTPRFNAIATAWRSMEWRAIARGLRRCALTRVAVDAREEFVQACTALGLQARPVTVAAKTAEMVVARGGDLESFERAWTLRDHDRIGLLLGYPACCRAAFVGWHAAGYEVDPTWALYAGPQHDGEICTVESPAAGADTANIFVRWLDVMAIPHIPCVPGCGASAEEAARWAQLGEELGFSAEQQWTREILSWPAEWSALHGIAEVKLPVLKFMTRTDATAIKYVVQWNGATVPSEAAQGVRFPFRPNPRRPMTRAASFTRGSMHIRRSGGLPDDPDDAS